jgi:hypothetical protein
MGDDTSTINIGGQIPFFFYDVIGRILPGAILLLGTILYFRSDFLTAWPEIIHTTFPPNSTAGYAAAIVLLFFGISHFLGLLLGSLSHAIVGKSWDSFAPLTLTEVIKQLAFVDTVELGKRFETLFGQKLPEDSENLNRASFLCSFYVWGTDANLGILTARDDAEALSSRCLVLVSIVLFIMPIFKCLIRPAHAAPTPIWFLCLAVISLGNGLYYTYLRKKRLVGRFALFMVATSTKADSLLRAPETGKTSAQP